MNTKFFTWMAVSALLITVLAVTPASAGSVVLTGHDTLLHSGQNGYDSVILDYLRGAGTVGEIAKAGYTVSVVGSDVGFARFTGQVSDFTGPAPATGLAISATGTLAGYGAATYYQTGTGADWSTILAADVLIILSHTSCGGCDLDTAGSAEINSNAAAIGTAFDAGMDIWGLSSATLSTYYDFLPAGAAAAGTSIGGSTGFSTTAAGAAIGITDGPSSMINGFPTHNRFTSISSAFTVFEVRGAEIITVGARDVSISDLGVPEPSTIVLLGLGAGLVGFAARRRRRNLTKSA